MRLGRSPPYLGKVPILFGEGPAYGWGRSPPCLGKVNFRGQDLPHQNATTVPSDAESPGKVPILKFDLPHSPLGPSPFTLGTFPVRPQDLSPFTLPRTFPIHTAQDLPPLPLGPSPFTLGTVPGGTQYPARREMTGALRLLGITVGAIRNQSKGANWAAGCPSASLQTAAIQHLAK